MLDYLPASLNTKAIRSGDFEQSILTSQYSQSTSTGRSPRGYWENPTASNAIRIHQKLNNMFSFTKTDISDVTEEKMAAAFQEASGLVLSGLFGVNVIPEIGIDSFGEIIFTHKSSKGYVDIGCRGDGELSYHIRNDADSSQSAFDDVPFNGSALPLKLIEAINALFE